MSHLSKVQVAIRDIDVLGEALLALGQVPPPTGSPIAFQSVLPQEQYAALCRLLPLAEPETLYINGGEVRCSVVEEDYLPLLERLGSL